MYLKGAVRLDGAEMVRCYSDIKGGDVFNVLKNPGLLKPSLEGGGESSGSTGLCAVSVQWCWRWVCQQKPSQSS